MGILDLSQVPCILCIENKGTQGRTVKVAGSTSNFILLPSSAIHIQARTSSELLAYLMQGDNTLEVEFYTPGEAVSGFILDSETGNFIINSLTGNFVVEENC